MRSTRLIWLLPCCLSGCGEAPLASGIPIASTVIANPEPARTPTSAENGVPTPPPSASPAEETDELGVIQRTPPSFVETKPLTRDKPSSSDAPFIAAGCSASRGALDCSKPLHAPSDIALPETPELEYLTPQLPIVSFWEPPLAGTAGAQGPPEDIRESRGMLQAHIVFAIPNGKQLDLVRTRAEFRKRFAPVSSPAEAIAFAVAFTGARPVYSPRYIQGMRYYTDRIEGTRVVEANAVYRLTLFDQEIFGCGLKPTLREELEVTQAGDVKVISTQPIYADPKSKGVCVD